MTLANSIWRAAVAGRWIARFAGTLMVLFLLAFVIGEGFPFRGMAAREQLYAVGVGCLFLGLIVAWFQEGWGGLMSLAGWMLLALLARRPAWDLVFAIPAVVGAVHLLCWWRLRAPAPATLPASFARGPLLVAATLAGVFVLLCANEIFSEPPLMSSMSPIPPALAGTWRADLTTVTRQPLPQPLPVVFEIAPNGAVSGTIGGAAITEARLVHNRSWFGRLMHWRTDYLIEGRLPRTVASYGGIEGDRFTAPLESTGDALHGALFLSHPAPPRPLGCDLTHIAGTSKR